MAIPLSVASLLRTVIIGSTEEKEKEDMERGDRKKVESICTERSACDKLAKLKNECIIMLRMKVKNEGIINVYYNSHSYIIISRMNVLLM